MKKIGTVTMYHRNANFGASLQAYALVKMLNNLGYDAQVVNIDFYSEVGSKNEITIKKLKNIFSDPLQVCKNQYKKMHKKFFLSQDIKNEIEKNKLHIQAVDKFKADFIPHSNLIHHTKLNEFADKYDILIAGSDQVWNPQYWKEAYFLSFAGKNTKKISYAASIAVNSYTKEQQKYTKKYLKDFSSISVREKEGKNILDSFLDKPIEVVMDPTFLLSKNEWNEIVTPVENINKPYVLCFFIGKNEIHREWATKMAKKSGLNLISLSDGVLKEMDINHGDKRLYNVDSRQFMWLIKNAEYVITDSFHCMVFSIIFESKFYIYKRDNDSDTKSMNSRIYTLTQMLGLQSQIVDGDESKWNFDKTSEEIYDGVSEKIQKEVDRSLEYLKKALGE